MEDYSQRRHIIMINRAFQGKLILKFILVDLLIISLFGIFLYIFLNSEVKANLQSAHITYSNISDMLFPVILTLSLLTLIISAVIIAFFVTFASHKIAGPMYRFNEALKSFSQRDLNAYTSIRKKDQLYECSFSLKKMVSVFCSDIESIKNSLKELEEAIENGDTEKAKQKTAEIRAKAESYKI